MGETPDYLKPVMCPKCGMKMVSRKSKHGVFWGCSQYPKCNGTRDSMGKSQRDRDNERINNDDEDDNA